MASDSISPTTPFDKLPEWLTAREAAKYMGLHYSTVYKSIEKGEIPHRKFGHKKLFVPKWFFDPNTPAKPSDEDAAAALAEAAV